MDITMKPKQYARSGAFLIELILSVAFLAVCGCICLSIFVKANSVSQSSLNETQAVNAAQSAAEQFKASPLEWERQASVTRFYTADWQVAEAADAGGFVLSVAVSRKEAGNGMLTAEIYVGAADSSVLPLFELTVEKYAPAESAGRASA